MSAERDRLLTYVIVTPARNEEQFIGLTLESMIHQTLPPMRWVIVSDGSTDRTDDIVKHYMQRCAWIDLVRLPERRERNYAAKVQAFNAGYQRLSTLRFDVVGNLDADISFEPRYFEFLIGQLTKNPRLGVAGTPFVEDGRQYDYRITNIEHVSGACQLFRRACFDQIGGYVPIKTGGIDWVVVTTARMKGWQTRTFLEMTCTHRRPMGTASSKGRVQALFGHGQTDWALGGHPLWQLFRSVYQMTRRPYALGGAALLAGYAAASVSRRQRPVSNELVTFSRSEQMARLKALFRYSRTRNRYAATASKS